MSDQPSLLFRWRRVILTTLIALWLTAFTLTHLPPKEVPQFHLSDKILHTSGFLGLATAFAITLQAYGVRCKRRILLVILIMLAYGAFDETTQPYFGRECDIFDWLSDAVGTTAALILTETLAFLLGRLQKIDKQS